MNAYKHEDGRITYTREHWWEWITFPLAYQYTWEGNRYPRFYLPVRGKDWDATNCYECWIFPLAPFAIAWIIAWRMGRSLWHDLVSFAHDIK